jgi:hypothetical protein
MWQPGMTLEDCEREVIEKAYAFYQRNKTHTARSLDIAIRTLDNKLEQYESLRTRTGSDVEPVAQVSEKQSVPVQERTEVQKVSPSHSTARGKKARA